MKAKTNQTEQISKASQIPMWPFFLVLYFAVPFSYLVIGKDFLTKAGVAAVEMDVFITASDSLNELALMFGMGTVAVNFDFEAGPCVGFYDYGILSRVYGWRSVPGP